jgi:hypothetical protein
LCRCRYENDPKYHEAKEELAEAKEELAEAKDALKRKEEKELVLLKLLEEDKRRAAGKLRGEGWNAQCVHRVPPVHLLRRQGVLQGLLWNLGGVQEQLGRLACLEEACMGTQSFQPVHSIAPVQCTPW